MAVIHRTWGLLALLGLSTIAGCAHQAAGRGSPVEAPAWPVARPATWHPVATPEPRSVLPLKRPPPEGEGDVPAIPAEWIMPQVGQDKHVVNVSVPAPSPPSDRSSYCAWADEDACAAAVAADLAMLAIIAAAIHAAH